MENILKMKVNSNPVKGKTTINHNVRLKLKINCSEYVLLDYMVEHIHNQKKTFNNSHCETYTGFNLTEQEILIQSLEDKGLAYYNNNQNLKPNVDSWDAAWPDLDKEFKIFWTREEVESNGTITSKTDWPGSKSDALSKFKEARKLVSFEYLMKQRKAYEDVLEYQRAHKFQRQKMGGPVFLNPKTRKFDSDFEQELYDLKKMNGEFDKDKKENKEVVVSKKDIFKDE